MKQSVRKEYLAALGIETWALRSSPKSAQVGPPAPAPAPPLCVSVPSTPATAVAGAQREDGADWAELRARVAACTRCSLSATRTQTVFGVGNLRTEWLIVGEAPGAEETGEASPSSAGPGSSSTRCFARSDWPASRCTSPIS